MATQKTRTKSSPSSSKKREKTQVDDPIIIKGGSVSVQFEDDTKFRKDSGHNKNKFDHRDVSRELTQLVVLRRDANGIYREYRRVALEKTDNIVICYTGSLCA